MSTDKPPTRPDPCKLFSIRQYECKPGVKVTCWPLDRIFRQCGKGPAIEVTNAVIDSQSGQIVIDPKILEDLGRDSISVALRHDQCVARSSALRPMPVSKRPVMNHPTEATPRALAGHASPTSLLEITGNFSAYFSDATEVSPADDSVAPSLVSKVGALPLVESAWRIAFSESTALWPLAADAPSAWVSLGSSTFFCKA
ncbi:hypothetical protein BD324DRAFT_653659 [Kockovaella imperatae]|uniref:Uncharacterized protein n=1 Tax=Kockovaella imperatae TaxID=4999 RepID=A0A1Y1U7F4_9TREE|nr:hypothetical protein BD324DRAFT_653659 [Kockovaella imperatae]ORX33961.1 hypothetical protein BD324DRAFT_653659 [Kockovaella imperatae]